jgi:glycosyltransferase involved in cell wall biosynthesis
MVAYRITDWLCDTTTAVSDVARNDAIRGGAVSAGRIITMPNGLDLSRYARHVVARDRLRRELGLGDGFVWLAVGRLAAAKDYPNLIHAFSKLDRPDKDVRLVIAGGGPDEAIRARLLDYGLERRVQLLGARPDVPALILVGRQDVRTPLAEAKTVAARLPRATVIAVPDEGHSLIGGSPCANRALRDFSRALRSPTSTCKPLRSLRFRASPSPRLRLRVGERRDASVLSALYQTFFSAEDGAYALSVPTESGWVMGGLRTGVVHIGADFETYRFRGYSDLPGFVVSGTITRRRFDLTVTGMWHGRVVYSKKTGVVVHEDPLDVRLRG